MTRIVGRAKKPVRRRKKHANFSLPERKRKKQAYLAALEQTGNSASACEIVGIHRNLPYWWMETDKKFMEQRAKAQYRGEQGNADVLEGEADRRAMGYEADKWFQGKVVGKEIQHSDLLLMFKLKAMRPEKYREDVRVAKDGAVNVQVNLYSGSAPHPQPRGDNLPVQGQTIDLGPSNGGES